jgi:hypothetical protein
MDEFLAKHMFHPPIIGLCQWRGCDQHTVANYLWTIAAMIQLMDIPDNALDGVFYAFWIIATIFCIQRLVVAANTRVSPNLFMRLMSVGFTFMLMFFVAAGKPLRFDDMFFPVIAFAEYARTIVSIPPRKPKERSARLARARS